MQNINIHEQYCVGCNNILNLASNIKDRKGTGARTFQTKYYLKTLSKILVHCWFITEIVIFKITFYISKGTFDFYFIIINLYFNFNSYKKIINVFL